MFVSSIHPQFFVRLLLLANIYCRPHIVGPTFADKIRYIVHHALYVSGPFAIFGKKLFSNQTFTMYRNIANYCPMDTNLI